MVAPNTFTTTGSHFGTNMTYSPVSHQGRRESLSMFNPQVNLQLATNPAITRPGSVPAQHQQSTALSHTPTHPYNTLPYQFSQPISSAASGVTTAVTTAPSDPTETIFWNPIPGVPGPTLPRDTYPQISPMGLGSVLQHQDMSDKLGRDGFKMSEDWQSSHVHGFTSGSGPNYSQPSHQPQSAGYMHRSAQSYHQQGAGMQYREQAPGSQQGGQEDYATAWYGNSMS